MIPPSRRRHFGDRLLRPGVAQGELLDRQTAPCGFDQGAADCEMATGIGRSDRRLVAGLDRRCGPLVMPARRLIVLEMRQVGTDDQQRIIGPDPGDRRGYRRGRCRPEQQRHDRQPAEDRLQDRKLDLDRVLRCVRLIVDRNEGVRTECFDRRNIDRNLAERGRKRRVRRRRYAGERHEVRRSDDSSALDTTVQAAHTGEGRCHDRSRIAVAGVRRDDAAALQALSDVGAGKEIVDGPA